VGGCCCPAFPRQGLHGRGRPGLLRHLFDDLGVHKVEAVIRPENKPSSALASALGFRLEVADPRPLVRLGHWHSVMIYGLIAGEER